MFSTKDLEKLQAEGKIRGYTETSLVVNRPGSKSKMGNKIVEFDGIKFRSKKELAWYVKLRMLVAAGEITDLRLQVPYELNEGGTHSYRYYADFVFIEKGKEVVMDVKGYRTTVYKKKCALMLKVHKITIREV